MMAKKIKLILIVIILCHAPLYLIADDSIDEAKVIAALTTNLLRFTSGIESKKSIELCILANDDIVAAFELKKTIDLKDKKYLAKTRNVRNLMDLNSCNILFISDLVRDELKYDALLKVSKHPVLTIANFAQNTSDEVMVNFTKKSDNTHSLSVNLTLLERANIKLSSRILKLALITSEKHRAK